MINSYIEICSISLCQIRKATRWVAFLIGGAEPQSILLAQGYLSNVETKLNLENEYRNLRKLPECQVGIRDPLSQIWLVGKETLQGPRNGRK